MHKEETVLGKRTMEKQAIERQSIEKQAMEEKGLRNCRLLGQGAFCRVYCVEDEAEGKVYACKAGENGKLLEREAAVMETLHHPLFPKCYELWKSGGMAFLLMEYVPGSSMEDMLRRRGYFSVRQVARTALELADGLLYLHERKERWLFRDVKPANVMIRQDGAVKLLDFGCVCGAGDRRNSQAGSPGFAAPEQLVGQHALTTACDVYGLGRTLQEMLGTEGRSLRERGREPIILEEAHRIIYKSSSGKEARQEKERKQEKEKRQEKERKQEKEKRQEKGRKQEKEGRQEKGRRQEKEGRQEREARSALEQLLSACTAREASERLPDMRAVREELRSFCREQGEAFWGGRNALEEMEIRHLKNIFEQG